MAQWATFAGLTGVVTALLLVLSYLTKTALTDPELGASVDESSQDDSRTSSTADASVSTDRSGVDGDVSAVDGAENSRASSSDSVELHDSTDSRGDSAERSDEPVEREGLLTETDRTTASSVDRSDAENVQTDAGGTRNALDGSSGAGSETMTSGMLLANVALSQGLFAAVLVGAAVYTEIPPGALGIAFSSNYVATGVVTGTAFGVALYVANEAGSLSAKRLGIDHSEELREMLGPETVGGWLVLLLAVLPLIAVFEEFLFRAALIGALSTGFGLSPWPLVVISSFAFALGHGMQGPAGVAVTGLLGLVLGAAFVLSGSLLLVVVAHYLINVLEFVVHEGLGVEWTDSIES